jgi:hypothetical protein
VKRALFALVSICSGIISLFFAWYTVRLIWVNLFVAGAARHRQNGMYIGAIAFPVAALLFGFISVRCGRSARGSRA